jgi:uncharacterized membrane protein
MNAAHFHLMVNHLPIIFPIVGIIVLIIGLVIKSDAVKRTAYLIFIIGALASIVAMKSGEEAEDVVENISGVTENYIESHEEAADVFSILTYILGALSLFGLWTNIKEKSITNVTGIAVLVFAFVVLYFGFNTGTTGGEIRHTEIRADNTTPPIKEIHETDNDD